MKKLKYSFLSLLMVLIAFSCNDEINRTLTDEFVDIDSSNTSLLFLRVGDGQPVSFGVPVKLIAAAKSNAVSFTFDVISSSTAIEGLHYDVQSNSGSIPANSYEGELPIVVYPDNLELGEIVTLDLALRDSDVKLARTDTVSFEFQITCPSDLAGTYDAVTTGTSTDPCCPGEVMATSVVTLTDKGSGVYTINDWSAGIYLAWYAVYGISAATVEGGGLNGDITELCGSVSGSFGEPFGTAVTLTGSVDPSTGVITYNWVNGYADAATVTLTPR
jgi:hypothetical protein